MLNEIKQDVQDSGGRLELRLFPQAAYATLFVQAVQGPAILLHKVAQKYTARQLWAPLSAALEFLYQLASGNFRQLPEGLKTLLSLGMVLVVLVAIDLIQKPAKCHQCELYFNTLCFDHCLSKQQYSLWFSTAVINAIHGFKICLSDD